MINCKKQSNLILLQTTYFFNKNFSRADVLVEVKNGKAKIVKINQLKGNVIDLSDIKRCLNDAVVLSKEW